MVTLERDAVYPQLREGTAAQARVLGGADGYPCLVLLSYFIWALWSAFWVGDFFSVVGGYYHFGVVSRFSLLFRALNLLLCFAFLFISRDNDRTLSVVLLLSVLNIVAICVVSPLYFEGVQSSFETINVTIKQLAFFVYYSVLVKMLNLGLIQKKRIKLFFNVNIFIYTFFILLGGCTGGDLFSSYDGGGRFGFKGILQAQNEATFFLLISFGWIVITAKRSFIQFTLMIMTLFSLLLLGTKGGLVGALLLAFGFLIAKKGFIRGGGYSLLILILFCLLSYTAYLTVDFVQAGFDLSYGYFKYHYENTLSSSVVGLLLSGRNLKAVEVFNECSGIKAICYLFGGYPLGRYQAEMGVLDLILSFGFVGALIYLLLWIELWTKKNLRTALVHSYLLVVMAVLLFLDFLGGHMFPSAMVALYSAMLLAFSEERIYYLRL